MLGPVVSLSFYIPSVPVWCASFYINFCPFFSLCQLLLLLHLCFLKITSSLTIPSLRAFTVTFFFHFSHSFSSLFSFSQHPHFLFPFFFLFSSDNVSSLSHFRPWRLTCGPSVDELCASALWHFRRRVVGPSSPQRGEGIRPARPDAPLRPADGGTRRRRGARRHSPPRSQRCDGWGGTREAPPADGSHS